MNRWWIGAGLCCTACNVTPPNGQLLGGAGASAAPSNATSSSAPSVGSATLAAAPATTSESNLGSAPASDNFRTNPAAPGAPTGVSSEVDAGAPASDDSAADAAALSGAAPIASSTPPPLVNAAGAPSDTRGASTPAAPQLPSTQLPGNAPLVTVSFTFDDSYAPQTNAATILETHGLRGTFYVNSPRLYQATSEPGSEYMTLANALDLQARGHDVGGHTLGHLSLTDIPESERIREIMGDRSELVKMGLQPRSFAYPYGHVEDDNAALGRPVLDITRTSGYASGRDTNGFDLGSCTPGPETLPPGDPFLLRSIRSVNEPPDGAATRVPLDDADTLLGWMDSVAACGGGWLPLIFHHLRDDCTAPDSPTTYCFNFGELDKLAASVATGVRCPGPTNASCYAIQVQRVSDAIGIAPLAPAPEVPHLRNASLERTDDSGATECVQDTGDAATAAFSRSTIAHTGQSSERLELANVAGATGEIGVALDFGECSIFSTAGNAYEFSLYYQADPTGPIPTLQLVTYRLTSDYVWHEWEHSVAFAAASPGTWVQRGFITPPIPAGVIAVSFSLRQESAGIIYVDDFDSVPLGPNGTPAN